MKPAAFAYSRPGTIEEALEILQRHAPEARLLAGGQSLVPLMNFRLARPEHVVDLNAISELSRVRLDNGTLVLGAMVRQSTIEDSELVARSCPLLVEATRFIGHRTIRNRGTVGGSLAHADPAAEYPAVLAALGGEVVVRDTKSERVVPASELFLTVCTTSLAPDELLTEVRLPSMPPRTGWAFTELSRRFGDYALVGAATVVTLGRDGRCKNARIALVGVGDTPIRCQDAESLLTGKQLNPDAIAQAAAECSAAADPEDDVHASATYKKAMVSVFVQRALGQALRRATGGADAA